MRSYVLTACAALGIAASAAMADPVNITFFNITNNGSPDVAGQLLCVLSDAGSGQVNFRFTNDVGIQSSITDVYFDDGTLLGIAAISDSGASVSFSQFASPGNLPGGNDVGFQTTAGFSADSNPPTMPMGVNTASEFLDIRFNLINGMTFADTVAALGTGELRIGMHMQGFGDGGSDSYTNGGPPTIIPLPAASMMGFAGLMGLAFARRR